MFTEVYKENAGTPPILLRAMAFRRACEEAPCIIQDNELIVGCPCGAPRAGAFSPDIAWRWLKDEIDTVSTRAQDPYQLAEEDKKVLLEEIFPYWEGRSGSRESGSSPTIPSQATSRTTRSTEAGTPLPDTTSYS